MSTGGEKKPGFWNRTTVTISGITLAVTAASGLVVAVRNFGEDGKSPPRPTQPPTSFKAVNWANDASIVCDEHERAVTKDGQRLLNDEQKAQAGDYRDYGQAAQGLASDVSDLTADLRKIPTAGASSPDSIQASIRASEDVFSTLNSLGVDLQRGDAVSAQADFKAFQKAQQAASAAFRAIGADACV